MTYSNPYFGHEERSPYELGNLLRELPPDLDIATTPITDEQHEKMLAADQHAANYISTLLNGMESLGRALHSAASNPRTPLSLDDAAQVGTLVSELAMQLQFLDDFRGGVAGRNLHMAFMAAKGAGK